MAEFRYRRVTSIWSLLFPLVSILIASTCTCYPSSDGHRFGTTSFVEHLLSPSSHRSEQVRPPSWLRMTSPSGEKFNRQTRNGPRYCGPVLNEVLSLVCKNVYKRSSQMTPWKLNGNDERSHLERNRMEDGGGEWSVDDGDQSQVDQEVDWTTDVDSITKRNTIGVVDECCHKSCPVSTLRTYCGSNQKKKRSPENLNP